MQLSEYARNLQLETDKQMLIIVLMHIPVVGLLIPYGYGTYLFALIASVLTGAIALIGYSALKGTRGCSMVFAICLMLFSGIMIQAQMGRIEMHFHIFGALPLLVIYRDWRPLLLAAAFIALHHLLLTGLQLSGVSAGGMPLTIFNYGCSWDITFLHAAFVVFEAAILILFSIKMRQEREQATGMIDIVDRFITQQDMTGRLPSGTASSDAFNNMMAQFSDLVQQVRAFSDELADSSTQLTQVSQFTTQTADIQQEKTQVSATATHQMSATIQEVAYNAQQASENAHHASSSADEGRRSIQEAITQTQHVDQAMSESTAMVEALVSKVDSITKITLSINDISEQTNLLALNAAIEAARAGEQGRGFAVVADEVRTLAGRTQELTSQISQTLHELTQISDKTLNSIGSGKTLSSETVVSVNQASLALDRIEAAIQEVGKMNFQIASASEEQAATSVEINQNIQELASQSDGLISNANQARQLSETLDQRILLINQMISKYKLA